MVRPRSRSALGALAAAAVAMLLAPAPAVADPASVNLEVVRWQVIKGQSGPVNYYRVVGDEPPMPFVRAQYRPPEATVVLGHEIAEDQRRAARKLTWQWRAMTLPSGGNECVAGKRDSAANVYVTWRSGLRWHTLKYSWSAVGVRGAVCDRKRSPFLAQDTILLESGGPTGVWRQEEIDLKTEFRRHFDDGDMQGDVPDFVGVGIMTDGDDTKSESAADYADFVLIR